MCGVISTHSSGAWSHRRTTPRWITLFTALEGPDDMPAHIKAALTAVSLSVPVMAGRLALGTWQGIYLFEHRVAPHRRQVVLHLGVTCRRMSRGGSGYVP